MNGMISGGITPAAPAGNKKQRELYVGGLLEGVQGERASP